MPFKKGQSGNPGGRVKDKPWIDALRIESKALDKKGRPKLRVLAEKVFEMALAGDMAAIREIGDRLDGKPVQAIAGEPGRPLETIQRIERVIVEPKNPHR